MAKAGVTQVEDLDDAESEVSESWNEEILFETPLDNIDVFVEFSNAMQSKSSSALRYNTVSI